MSIKMEETRYVLNYTWSNGEQTHLVFKLKCDREDWRKSIMHYTGIDYIETHQFVMLLTHAVAQPLTDVKAWGRNAKGQLRRLTV